MIKYQQLAMRTAKPLATQKEKLLHAALGAGSEVGEFAMATFKYHTLGVIDDHNIVEELGDICWYIAILSDAMGFEFDSLIPEEDQFMNQFEKDFGAGRFKSNVERHLALTYYAGDIQTLVKTHVYCDKPIDQVKLIQAAGMVLSSAFAIAQFFGFKPEDVLEANIAKLTKRYPDKFTNDAAIARADKV